MATDAVVNGRALGPMPVTVSTQAWVKACDEYDRVVAELRASNPDAPEEWLMLKEQACAEMAHGYAHRLDMERVEGWQEGDGVPIPYAVWHAMQDALKGVPMDVRTMTFPELPDAPQACRVWRWHQVQQSHRGLGSRVGGRDWWRPQYRDLVYQEPVKADARGYTTARPTRDRP